MIPCTQTPGVLSRVPQGRLRLGFLTSSVQFQGKRYFLKHSLGGTDDLRSERLGMGPREYHHRDQRRPGRLGGVGLKFYPWRISRDLG